LFVLTLSQMIFAYEDQICKLTVLAALSSGPIEKGQVRNLPPTNREPNMPEGP